MTLQFNTENTDPQETLGIRDGLSALLDQGKGCKSLKGPNGRVWMGHHSPSTYKKLAKCFIYIWAFK